MPLPFTYTGSTSSLLQYTNCLDRRSLNQRNLARFSLWPFEQRCRFACLLTFFSGDGAVPVLFESHQWAHGFAWLVGISEMTYNCYCDSVAVILILHTKKNPSRHFLRCPYYRDPSKCCKYFRWVDESSTSALKSSNSSQYESGSKLHFEGKLVPYDYEQLVADMGELLRCVSDLREIHIAVKRDIDLKCALERRELELLKMKIALGILISLVSAVLLAMMY